MSPLFTVEYLPSLNLISPRMLPLLSKYQIIFFQVIYYNVNPFTDVFSPLLRAAVLGGTTTCMAILIF